MTQDITNEFNLSRIQKEFFGMRIWDYTFSALFILSTIMIFWIRGSIKNGNLDVIYENYTTPCFGIAFCCSMFFVITSLLLISWKSKLSLIINCICCVATMIAYSVFIYPLILFWDLLFYTADSNNATSFLIFLPMIFSLIGLVILLLRKSFYCNYKVLSEQRNCIVRELLMSYEDKEINKMLGYKRSYLSYYFVIISIVFTLTDRLTDQIFGMAMFFITGIWFIFEQLYEFSSTQDKLNYPLPVTYSLLKQEYKRRKAAKKKN